MWRSIDTRTLAKRPLIARVDNPTDLPVVAIRNYDGEQVEAKIVYHKGFVELIFTEEFEGEVALALPA